MTYQITFKTPYAVDNAVASIECTHEQERFENIINKYVKNGELVTLLVDTDKNTVTVKET